MTGCPGGDEDVELSVLSNKFGKALLIWKADGSVEEAAVSGVIPTDLNERLHDGQESAPH